jgi:sec-independent protein translocase protein TatC
MSVRPIGHEDRLSLVEHLDELRTRLIWSIAVLVIAFAFCYAENNRLLHIVNRPLEQSQKIDGGKKHKNAPLQQTARYQKDTGAFFRSVGPALAGVNDALTALGAGKGVSTQQRAQVAAASQRLRVAVTQARRAEASVPTNTTRQPVTLGVTEPFLSTFTVAGYAALLLAMPFLLYQAYAFVLPAFSPGERRQVLPLMLMVPVLFICGVLFSYFVALPRAVDFLQNFNSDNFDILVRAQDYYKFSVILLAGVGLLFQIPVGVLALTRLRIVTTKQLRKNRGYVLLAISILAAVATPTPDPVTMLVTMAPLVVLFELSILLARIFEPKAGTSRWSFGDDEDDDDGDDHGAPGTGLASPSVS